MKRIIFFAKSMEIGGLEKALLTLLNGIDHTRYRVTLVLEEKRGAFLARLDPRVEVCEYRLSECPIRPVRRAINLIRRVVWTARNRNAYDFACSYCTYSVIGSRLAQAASDNSCLYVHNDYAQILPDPAAFRAFFDSLRADRFRSVVFVSNESRAAFRARCGIPPERLHVINNLIDADEVRALAKQPCAVPPAPGCTTLLFVGRLDEEQKRLSRLLEAMRLALRSRSDLRLLIVGDGPARRACEQTVLAQGLSDRVLLCGAQENPYPYFAAADALVLTSDYEGFPVVFCEALLLGLDLFTTVSVSDGQIDIADHAVIMPKDAAAIGEALSAYTPQHRPPLDLSAANAQKLDMLSALIERGE